MKLENTMVVVANLGELKVFNVKKNEGVVENEMKVSHTLEPLNDIVYIDAHKRIQDIVSDSAGRLGNSTGENHNLKIERKRRSVKDVANDINAIVENEKPRQLLLAFPQESNAQLLEELTQETKNILAKNVTSDLVKTNRGEILSHF